jgi:hypothetical protein
MAFKSFYTNSSRVPKFAQTSCIALPSPLYFILLLLPVDKGLDSRMLVAVMRLISLHKILVRQAKHQPLGLRHQPELNHCSMKVAAAARLARTKLLELLVAAPGLFGREL